MHICIWAMYVHRAPAGAYSASPGQAPAPAQDRLMATDVIEQLASVYNVISNETVEAR